MDSSWFWDFSAFLIFLVSGFLGSWNFWNFVHFRILGLYFRVFAFVDYISGLWSLGWYKTDFWCFCVLSFFAGWLWLVVLYKLNIGFVVDCMLFSIWGYFVCCGKRWVLRLLVWFDCWMWGGTYGLGCVGYLFTCLDLWLFWYCLVDGFVWLYGLWLRFGF